MILPARGAIADASNCFWNGYTRPKQLKG